MFKFKKNHSFLKFVWHHNQIYFLFYLFIYFDFYLLLIVVVFPRREIKPNQIKILCN